MDRGNDPYLCVIEAAVKQVYGNKTADHAERGKINKESSRVVD